MKLSLVTMKQIRKTGKTRMTLKLKSKERPNQQSQKARRQLIGGCGSSDALVAAIRGRSNGSIDDEGEQFVCFLHRARRGVDTVNDDPLDDATFAKLKEEEKERKIGSWSSQTYRFFFVLSFFHIKSTAVSPYFGIFEEEEEAFDWEGILRGIGFVSTSHHEASRLWRCTPT